MSAVNIEGSKVTVEVDGKTRIFTLDAGSEIIYYCMHFFSNEQIVAGFQGTEAEKLLKHLPGYQANALPEADKGVCPTCQKPL
ncbi:hypothetical protein EBT31_22975 [bacterium]|nr:hypothetical protein [bacterium]